VTNKVTNRQAGKIKNKNEMLNSAMGTVYIFNLLKLNNKNTLARQLLTSKSKVVKTIF
jgi:hypothetical protein